jgi:hypothetical protein
MGAFQVQQMSFTMLHCGAAYQVDEGPERVLVLGWGPKCLMADLIKELDHGLSPLPASEVVFVNTHNPDDTLGAVLQNTTLDYIKVRCCWLQTLPNLVPVWYSAKCLPLAMTSRRAHSLLHVPNNTLSAGPTCWLAVCWTASLLHYCLLLARCTT